MKPTISLLYIALIAILIAAIFGSAYVIPVAFAVLLTASVFLPKGVSFMAITVEVWQKDIIDNLFKNNDFAKRAFIEDQYVKAGKIVHIPVAAKPGRSKVNLSQFPRSATKRGDDDVIYVIDTYYRDPKHVEDIEKYELSYDKRQSILGEEQAQLIQDAMDGLLYRWALKGKNMDQPGNYLLTTGAVTEADVLEDADGGRKTMTTAPFGQIKKKMDNANIPSDGRIALLTANHYQQFIDSLSDRQQTDFYRFADMQKGIIGNYLGFDVMMRSTVQRWRKVNNVWTPQNDLVDEWEADGNDSAASVFYQEKQVSRALGDVRVFDNQDRAEYYGDIVSQNMRLGGRVRRPEGVYSVIEDIAAA